MKSGTEAVVSPCSKCLRNSALRSMRSVFHSFSGAPDSSTTVSCAANGLLFLSHVAPFGPTALHTYLSAYQRSVRRHEMYTTAAESPLPASHSLPPFGSFTARQRQLRVRAEARSASGTSTPTTVVSYGGRYSARMNGGSASLNTL